MNILVLAPQPFFQNRGTPIATRRVLEVLSAHGHRIDVLTYHEGEDITIPNCTIHRIPHLPGIRRIRPGPSPAKLICDIAMLLKCLLMLRTRRWHVIHAVEEAAFLAILIKKLFHIPFVYDMDSCLSRQIVEKYPLTAPVAFLVRFLERTAVSSSVGVVTICKALEQTARSLNPYANVVRIEDVSLLDPGVVADDVLRDRLGIRGSIILYVGNLEPYQGIDLLLDGFADAAPEMPDTHLVVIGGSSRDVKKYRDRASQLRSESQIHFLGPRAIDQLGAYFQQADALVSPRVSGDNTPMKVYSYLDSGRPILATRLATHTQVLDDSVAYLVEPNPAAMAAGMKILIANPALGRDLALNAQQLVRTEYDPKVLDAKLAAFFAEIAEVLETPNRPGPRNGAWDAI